MFWSLRKLFRARVGALTAGALTVGVLLAGCSEPPATKDAIVPQTPASAPSFVNKVWTVQSSNTVAPGQIHVFLSEGTLLITSPNSKPVLGTWKQAGGALTMVEEGLSYPVEILELTPDRFRIRMKNPGEPVEITFRLGDQ